MNFLTKRLLGRMGPAGRIADAAIVGSAALRYAQRKGLVSDELASMLGASDRDAGSKISVGELFLLAAALYRLITYFTRRREKSTIIEI